MRLIWLLCLLAVSVSCSAPPPEPIKVGLSINLSGRGGMAGEHIRDGAMLAVREINEQGGINGRPLQLLVRDDENSDAGIIKADQGLIDEGVVAIIGHSFSANTLKAFPLVSGKGVVLLTGYTATTRLSGKDDLFFRTSVDCSLYGRKTAQLLEGRGTRSLSVLLDLSNSEYVLDYVEHLKRHFHGELTEVRFDSKQSVEWQAITEELMAPDPDAVLLLTEVSMTGVSAQKLRSGGFRGGLIATIWAQAPGLIDYGGKAVEGMSLVTFISASYETPVYQAFSARLMQEFNRPASARSARAYELVSVLADALRRCPSVSAAELKKQLPDRRYQTVLGEVELDRYGDVVRPVYEVVVAEGALRTKGVI